MPSDGQISPSARPHPERIQKHSVPAYLIESVARERSAGRSEPEPACQGFGRMNFALNKRFRAGKPLPSSCVSVPAHKITVIRLTSRAGCSDFYAAAECTADLHGRLPRLTVIIP